MTILVRDDGFHEVDLIEVELSPDCDPDEVDLSHKAMAILFPSFSDGRGFGIATALRRRGYQGRLRARGQILADQYAMARRVGFDEVEIPKELAERQGSAAYLARANWSARDYQARMGQKRPF